MLTCQRFHTRSLIKRLFNKLKNSIQTYINYHKTHAMATHFGGVRDTSMEDPDTQDIDNTSQDDLQDESIVQNLLCKTAHLRQAVENRDNDPREAIEQLEQRLSRLVVNYSNVQLCLTLVHILDNEP